MNYLELIKAPVKSEIEKFEKKLHQNISSNIPILDIIINYILRHKGKQIRPLLVFLSAKLVGDINESTYTAATLIELLHTATLIHDDVVDESYERRNHFSINAIWKTKAAVLIGDYFLSKGLLISIAKNELKLLETVSTAVKEMIEGEILQMQSSRKSIIDINNYLKIINKKTASLFASSMICGGQSVSDNEIYYQKLKQLGTIIGIIFQIKDDIFDYQKKYFIGKPIGNDIKDKKFTLPLILALENSSKKDGKNIINLINKGSNLKSKYNEIYKFIIQNKGIEESEKYLNDFKIKALDLLYFFPENEVRKSLEIFINYLIDRNN